MNRRQVKYGLIITGIVFCFSLFFINCKKSTTSWPEVTNETKPWTRWWWMGNSLTKEGITQAMDEYEKAGFGGLEITPIYGVKGYEDQFIDFLSPKWIELLEHTLKEGKRLGLGIDMATGTGWPFGGPSIDSAFACKNFYYNIYDLTTGERLKEPVVYIQQPYLRAINKSITIDDIQYPFNSNKNLQEMALDQVQFEKPLPLVTLMAYSDIGTNLDLTDKVNDKHILDWTAPEGNWTLYAIFMGWHGKMVERAAPGGEGNVLDHFSKEAINHYLNGFDKAFAKTDISSLRAFFNDSYEVDDARGEANFTPEFFDEFKTRKGYDLRNHLHQLLAADSSEIKSRLLCDYREVISDLLLDNFTQPWKEWAYRNQAIVRNQAHGSPANILDLYAASDIPETEGQDIAGMKLASSAANISGKKLVSSETATWLDEHFKASLADVKKAVDNCFIAGVNHIVYHGTTYSPEDEAWPGWMFYAAVHFGPTNPIWNDLTQLNDYITRCQSFLQSGKPSNDILVYYPMYDKWSETGRSFLYHFKQRPDGSGAYRIAERLMKLNYAFDFISDKQINQLTYTDSSLSTCYNKYKILIVPQTTHFSEVTFAHLLKLAKQGAIILFENNLPATFPGFSSYEERIQKFDSLKEQAPVCYLNLITGNNELVENGSFIVFNDLYEALGLVNVKPVLFQKLTTGLKVIRRENENGYCYFVINMDEFPYYGEVIIDDIPSVFVLFNSMTGVYGKLNKKSMNYGNAQIFLQLEPYESCIIQQYQKSPKTGYYPYINDMSSPVELQGDWNVRFISGGPVIPDEYVSQKLTSWTDNENSKYFSGTARYSLTFNKPEVPSEYWLLDLGELHESAKVYLNDKLLTTLICPPYRVIVEDEVLKVENRIDIEVTNLMANRMIYMDKEGINYKKFYNVNFPAKYAENRNDQGLFDASKWEPLSSGLLGPLTLFPVSIQKTKN